MFFDGDLQSGIALALKDSKIVACFLRGNDEESSLWEQDFLCDEQILVALTAKTINLRINSGSSEASYLSEYYPIPTVPALILIHNGQLLLDLRAGETKERFKSALLKTLSSPFPIATQSAAPGSPDPATNRASTDQGPSTAHDSSDLPAAANAAVNRGSDTRRSTSPQSITQGADALLFTAQPPSNEATLPLPPSSAMDPAHDHTPHSTSHSSSSANQHSQAVQNLLADRRRRLEIDKQEKDAAEKTDRKAKAKARRDAITNAPDSTKAKQATYAAQQRKRQQETKRERERILRQIEHDKAERREKEERRKALRVETESADGASGLVDQQLSNEVSAPRSMRSRDCAVQIRLFDGSTIRGNFSSNHTLSENVRSWVDENRSDDVPYTFKQILTPMPNRTLSMSEEEESLQSIGLSPSATLVMVPVEGYTAAYVGSQGIVAKTASVGYNVLSAGAGLVTGALGTFLGVGRAMTQGEEPSASASVTQSSPNSEARGKDSSVNVRTLREQEERRNDHHQLYNGNQLNFEPQQDPKDKDD